MNRKFSFIMILAILFFPVPSLAAQQSFDAWLDDFRGDARRKGISQSTIDLALKNVKSIPRVIELDRKQPEGQKTFTQYRRMIVNPKRIQDGRELLQAYRRELTQVEKKYGVPAQYIVALWGIETNFGSNTGGFDVIPALATLAWEGRRAAFFKKELVDALRIIDDGHISAANMKGSWAGAMGQSQFMPSSFIAYAADGNGDGRKDIWNTEMDVFASAANYLMKNGWRKGERWGRRAELPPGFSENMVGRKIKKSLRNWQKLGVRLEGGADLPDESGILASVVAPDGLEGEAFIVYNNYNVIMDWNRSTYFATSVGLLADAIAR